MGEFMSKVVFQKKEYETRTYEDLLSAFRLHWRRAIEIIPLLHNRLTLKDGYTHKQAMRRIRNDLKGIRGFSPRNIIRFLSSDNPMVPRRVRAVTPKWRKNSGTDTQLLEQQADRIKDAERKMGEMTSEINTLREQVNQDKIMIKIRDEKIENTLTRLEIADNLLAWTQKELATRDYQLREANEAKETWKFLACRWWTSLQEHEMALRRVVNKVLEHESTPKELEANTRRNEAAERATQGDQVNSVEEMDIALVNFIIIFMQFIFAELNKQERGG